MNSLKVLNNALSSDRPVHPEAAAARFIEHDPLHEQKHDQLVWGMRQHRDQAVAAMPEWDDLRTLASQIKEHTLTHLDQYLEGFDIAHLPKAVIDIPLNPWAKHRDMPAPPKQTFRQWFANDRADA